MEDLIVLLAKGKQITDEHIKSELYEICDRVHSSCDSECPVYRLNGNKIPDTVNDFKVNRGCDCFKSGANMLEFIRNARM
jgi:queuine/archaeosine tRNA-ribosyltransferase